MADLLELFDPEMAHALARPWLSALMPLLSLSDHCSEVPLYQPLWEVELGLQREVEQA